MDISDINKNLAKGWQQAKNAAELHFIYFIPVVFFAKWLSMLLVLNTKATHLSGFLFSFAVRTGLISPPTGGSIGARVTLQDPQNHDC